MTGSARLVQYNGTHVLPHPLSGYCPKCKIKLKLGEWIFSKRAKSSRKQYHEKCAQEYNLL